MSFASEVKKELIDISDLEPCCKKALLYGILQGSSEIIIGSIGYRLIIKTTLLNTLKVVKKLLDEYYPTDFVIGYTDEVSLRKRRFYSALITVNAEQIIKDFNLMPFTNLSRHDEIIDRPCCRASFIRGLFIAKGSINDPRKTCYHLEISSSKENVINLASKILNHKEIENKVIERNNQYVLYVKKSELISNTLAYMGADSGVFYFEDQRIVRDVSNMANRIANCDIANEIKCAKNCDKQLQAIEYIREHNMFSRLTPRLQTICIMREEYPESSLDELSYYSENIFGKPMSKSGISHCFKDLMEFYESIKID